MTDPLPPASSGSHRPMNRPEDWKSEGQAWNALSYVFSGAILGVLIGFGLRAVSGWEFMVPIGILVGLALAGYVVWVRYARP